jgi:hypothetical protein
MRQAMPEPGPGEYAKSYIITAHCLFEYAGPTLEERTTRTCSSPWTFCAARRD